LESLKVGPLTAADRQRWEVLARGYKEFYATPTTSAEFEAAWQRLQADTGPAGLGAWHDGQLVGIAHFLFHDSTWADRVCYLQDLFTDPSARGRGVARALIDAVARQARGRGATRLYWLTQQDNATARRLYDQVGRFNGFIRYDHPLAVDH
jgi:GNAT superfamily N-acetyltransferase